MVEPRIQRRQPILPWRFSFSLSKVEERIALCVGEEGGKERERERERENVRFLHSQKGSFTFNLIIRSILASCMLYYTGCPYFHYDNTSHGTWEGKCTHVPTSTTHSDHPSCMLHTTLYVSKKNLRSSWDSNSRLSNSCRLLLQLTYENF